jgi:hypothetical protein
MLAFVHGILVIVDWSIIVDYSMDFFRLERWGGDGAFGHFGG